jgi:hypothetical protein
VADVGGEERPKSGHRRLITAGVAVLVLVVVGIATVGMVTLTSQPRLAAGSFMGTTSTSRLVEDDLDGSRFVIIGTQGGVLHVSVRNPSRFTVTILGLALTPETPSSLRSISFEADPYVASQDLRVRRRAVAQVTLGHNQEAAVLINVRLPDCLGYSKGFTAMYDRVPVRVRRFRQTRTVMMPLEVPLWVSAVTDHPVSGPCPG